MSGERLPERRRTVVGLFVSLVCLLTLVTVGRGQEEPAADPAPPAETAGAGGEDDGEQVDPAGGEEEAESTGWFGSPMFLFAAMGLMFYFIVLRPGRNEKSRRAAMIKQLQKHDRVVTIGGIIGTIVAVDADRDEVILELDRDTQVRFERRSIRGAASEGTEKKGSEEAKSG